MSSRVMPVTIAAERKALVSFEDLQRTNQWNNWRTRPRSPATWQIDVAHRLRSSWGWIRCEIMHLRGICSFHNIQQLRWIVGLDEDGDWEEIRRLQAANLFPVAIFIKPNNPSQLLYVMETANASQMHNFTANSTPTWPKTMRNVNLSSGRRSRASSPVISLVSSLQIFKWDKCFSFCSDCHRHDARRHYQSHLHGHQWAIAAGRLGAIAAAALNTGALIHCSAFQAHFSIDLPMKCLQTSSLSFAHIHTRRCPLKTTAPIFAIQPTATVLRGPRAIERQ